MATAHTKGVNPAVNDPVFNSPADLGKLWKAWIEAAKLSGVDCGGTDTHAEDCVQIKNLEGVPTQFSTCSAVDNNKCTKKSDAIAMVAVKFEYQRSGNWILYDAALSARTDCT